MGTIQYRGRLNGPKPFNQSYWVNTSDPHYQKIRAEKIGDKIVPDVLLSSADLFI